LIKLKNVTKEFRLYSSNIERILDLFLLRKNRSVHRALNNISFNTNQGEVVGIVGLNGSGKSTLCNLIAGVTIPTEGTVEVNGTAALIAISSGLNNQLTGLENIELKGLMMGLSRQKIKEITPQVIEFAELGKFIHQPLKVYSSGMRARLGFAISVHIDPDILVIDEALSVGDQTFTDKCLNKVNEFKTRGKTIFFISHSLSQVKSFCNKAMWLHYGQLQRYGDVDEVLQEYQSFLKDYNKLSIEEKERLRAAHWGT
jgi:teichoic acid transport system ATP-binding protein